MDRGLRPNTADDDLAHNARLGPLQREVAWPLLRDHNPEQARSHSRASRRSQRPQMPTAIKSGGARSISRRRGWRRSFVGALPGLLARGRHRFAPVGGFFAKMLLSGGPQRSTRAESPVSPEISPKEICQTVFG